MKRGICLFVGLILLAQGVGAINSTIANEYSPRETIIGELTGSVLSPILREQVSLVRDGHISMGFDYDIKNLGGGYFIWLTAPQNEGNYTLIIKNIIAIQEGYPQVIDYRKDFSVLGEQIDYSIKPGIVFADKDFEIKVILYDDFTKSIGVDFPDAKDISLNPGINNLRFSIEGIVGNQFIPISVGQYSVPAYIVGAEYICGDGQIDGQEVCDGENVNDKNCTAISGSYVGGILSCSSNCLSFDTSQCEQEEVCNSGHIELCSTENECGAVGGYWYGGVCNEFEEGAACDSGHFGLCNSSATCLNVNGFWYSDECHEFEEGVACDLGHIELCSTENECGAVGGYWYGGVCNEFPAEHFLPEFRFNPGFIQSTALASNVPTYVFEIVNLGGGPISGMELRYDERVFKIQPEGAVSLRQNESKEFNMTIINVTGQRVRGVVFAKLGNVSEHLLFSVNFTNNEDSVSTNYLKDNSDNSGYYCSEIPGSAGSSCVTGEICTGSEVSSLDVSRCCVGECKTESGEGNAWIGYLIVAILIVVLGIIYTKYKKTKGPKNPMIARVSEVEKKLP